MHRDYGICIHAIYFKSFGGICEFQIIVEVFMNIRGIIIMKYKASILKNHDTMNLEIVMQRLIY